VDPPKRGVPKIVSNVQLVPPRPTAYHALELDTPREDPAVFSDFDTWTAVADRRNKKKRVRIDADKKMEDYRAPQAENSVGRPPPPPSPGGIRRRVPRRAAVAVKVNTDVVSYSDVMKRAKQSIKLSDLGITSFNSRKAANGSVLIEISGPDGHIKADTLATRLRDIIGDSAVISRPIVKADLRLVGFDESVIKDEVITVITDFGGCLASEVRVGPFRPMRNGSHMTWVQCPLSAAQRVSRRGKINLGWSVAKVELMKAKPIQAMSEIVVNRRWIGPATVLGAVPAIIHPTRVPLNLIA